MGIQPQQFEGISTNIPGAYAKANFPLAPGSGAASTNVVAIIGPNNSGIPYNATGFADENKVVRLGSVPQAQDVTQGGAGYYMSEFYMTPSDDPTLNSPTEVLLFTVNPSTRSTSIIRNLGDTADIIDLTTFRFGNVSRQVSYKIEAGTTAGYKITPKFKGNEAGLGATDNISLSYFSIIYTGAGTPATMTITPTGLTTAITGAAADNLAIVFADFLTLADLVAFINEQPTYTCDLLGNAGASPATLDVVTAVNILVAYTAQANIEAVIQFFNRNSGGEFIAALSSGATREPIALTAGNFVYMAGGSTVTPSSTDWANTFALMEKFDINGILVADASAAVHAQAKTHVTVMSSIENKKNRVVLSGGLAADTFTALLAAARAKNSARFEYCITSFSRADAFNSNLTREFDSFYGAALIAGIRYGNNVTISATFKQINVTALSANYSTTELKEAIDAGCTVFTPEKGRGFIVKHNVTTYQGANLILNLPSMLRNSDAIVLDIISTINLRLANYKEAPSELAVEDLRNFIVTNKLAQDYRDTKRWLTQYKTQDGTVKPAFSNVTFVQVGDRFNFGFTGVIPAPLHFGFFTMDFVVPGFEL